MKTLRKMVHTTSAALAILFACYGVHETRAASIAIDLGDNTAAMAPGDVVGVVPQANWNTLEGAANDLNDDSGTPTTLDVTGTTQSGWYTANFGNWTNPDRKMMHDGNYRNGSGTITVSLGQIPYAGYDVYVYVGTAEGGSGEGGAVTLTASGSYPTYYYLASPVSALSDKTYVQATATTQGSRFESNYVKWEGVSGTSLTVTIATINNQAVMLGIQIVESASSPTVSLSVLPATIDEDGEESATVTATASSAVSGDVIVNLDFSASTAELTTDYTRSGTSITILDGQTEGSITVTAVDDTLYEDPSETIVVAISSVTGDAVEDGDQEETVTITDADLEVLVATPTAGQQFTTTQDIELTATVEVGLGPYSVQYYMGPVGSAVAVGSPVATAPYTYNSGTHAVGDYEIYAVATDAASDPHTSPTIQIEVVPAAIGIDLGNNYATMAAGDTAGVVQQGNWTTLESTGSDMKDSTGAATTLDVTSLSGGWYTMDGSFSDPDKKMMGDASFSNGGSVSIGLNQIPYAYYDAYVYVGGSSGSDSGGSVSDGTTTYWYDYDSNLGTYVQATATTQGDAQAAGSRNYVRFEQLNSAALTITLSAPGGDFGQVQLAGVQIVDVPPANPPPEFVQSDPYTLAGVTEDGSGVSFTLDATDPNGDDSQIAWSISANPAKGSAVVTDPGITAASKEITYTPDPDASGADTFEVQITDEGSATATLTVNLDIAGSQDAPTAANNTVTAAEGVAYTFASSDFNFNDVDPGDVLTQVQIVSVETAGDLEYDSGTWDDVTAGQVITAADIDAGKLRFTSSDKVYGTGSDYATFEFKVHDGTEYSASAYTMTVDVTQNNASPLSIVVNAEVVVEETTVGTFETLSDGTIAYAITGGANESLFGITSPGGVLTMNTAPTAGDIGAEYYVEVTASDDIPSSGTVLVRVTVVGVAISDSGTVFVFR